MRGSGSRVGVAGVFIMASLAGRYVRQTCYYTWFFLPRRFFSATGSSGDANRVVPFVAPPRIITPQAG